MYKHVLVWAGALALLLPLAGLWGEDGARPTIEEVFRVKPYQGKQARSLTFSDNERYLSFLWNPFGEEGWDLYIYDLKMARLKRVTALPRMKAFMSTRDAEAMERETRKIKEHQVREQEQIERYQAYLAGEDVDLDSWEKEDIADLKKTLDERKQREEAAKGWQLLAEQDKKEAQEKAASVEKKEPAAGDAKADDSPQTAQDAKGEKKKDEKELWELRDQLKEERRREEKDRDVPYSGVRSVIWSPRNDQLIFAFRNDLFRYFPGGDRLECLTRTEAKEQPVQYDASGKGYFYMIGADLYHATFGSARHIQVTPLLPEEDGYTLADSHLSPDGRWLFVEGIKKPQGKTRRVSMMDYRERFAKPVEMDREVSDDTLLTPHRRFFLLPVDLSHPQSLKDPVFELPGGDVWFEISELAWDREGRHYGFMTWEREKGRLCIWVGEPGSGKKPRLLSRTEEVIGYKNTYSRNLCFSPDGRTLAAVMSNEKGFRQAFVFDLARGERRDLLPGASYESWSILGFSGDSKRLFVLSDRENPAMSGVYAVSLSSGEMTAAGRLGGQNRGAVISRNGTWLASNYGHFREWTELNVKRVNEQRHRVLTDSHDPGWKPIREAVVPELFTYPNRHGDVIHGLVFRPDGWKPEDRRPAIVYMYGGPLGRSHSVEVDTTHRLAYLFQLYMTWKHGYVTVVVDPRGQSGYGRRFQEANWKDPGKAQTEDLEDLVTLMGKDWGVDQKRIGLHGWSFGGFQTLHTLFHSPETFACGIATASPTQWENYNSWYSASTIDASERGKPTLRRHSLIPWARYLRRPLLLVHGMLDDNVLYQDTVNVYRALLQSGKETLVDLFLDPDGDHGLGGAVKNWTVFRKYESWFLRNLGTMKP